MRNTSQFQSAIQEDNLNFKTIQNGKQEKEKKHNFSQIKAPTKQNHFHKHKDSIPYMIQKKHPINVE